MPAAGDGPIHVLHVEDDEAFATLVADGLGRQGHGFTITHRSDVDRALETLEAEPVDCVVSDFDMPGATGLEFLEAVRERYADLPFILYTGKGSEEVASDAIATGVTDYLRKGGGNEQFALLANRIENAVEAHRADAELAAERNRYELLGRASADAFWDWDLVTGHAERSEGFGRLFGYDPDDITTDTDWWRERLHPEDRDRVETALDTAIEQGESVYEADYRFRNADGSYSEVLSRGFVVYDDGEPVRVVGTMTDVSGLREQEARVAAMRTRLELVLDGTDTGVWEWDPATDAVVWDETVERLYGLEPGSFAGTYEAFADRVYEEDVERLESAIERTLADGSDYDVEFRIRRTDGEIRWVRAEGILEERTGGRRLLGLLRDVTERKAREARLEQVERRFDAVFHDPAVFMALLDPDGTLLLENQTAAAFMGHPNDDRLGYHFLETAWWTDASAMTRAEVEERLERASRGEFVQYRATHENDEGDAVVLESHIRPVTDEDGTVLSLLVEGVDVSDRVEREETIERLHGATRALLRAEEPPEVASLLSTIVTEVLDFPSNVVRLRREDELVPVVVSEDVLERVGDRPVYGIQGEPAGRAIERGDPVVVEDVSRLDERIDRGSDRPRLYAPIGDRGTISISIPVDETFASADIALVMILANNAESVLERLEGERAVRRRGRELARQNDRLEQFASVISHDLRNPLSVAIARLDLMEVENEHTAALETSLSRMDELLDNVLELARKGQVVGDPVPVDLGAVARAAWETVVTEDAELVVEDVGTVAADETRLQELLENLFRNAVEHAGPTAAVRVEALEDGFAVEDDGPGVPADEQERIFEPGFTTDEAGTGFGLALVESIASAHGWRIELAEAEGARFEVRTVVHQAVTR